MWKLRDVGRGGSAKEDASRFASPSSGAGSVTGRNEIQQRQEQRQQRADFEALLRQRVQEIHHMTEQQNQLSRSNIKNAIKSHADGFARVACKECLKC
ncbi:hypothetical protein EAG_13821 [Camponotus floridanus]|uniref:Uncharacterized protein n=1 Tax=Camponotus floridanus TaxID=104421 RepID=E2A7U2_CAMFO|nr:hypothetical protein EAG_13821 [Camponotus floridanus]